MYLFGRCSPGEIAPTFTERFGIACGGCDRERFAAQNRREASMFRSILAVLVILTTPALALDQPTVWRDPDTSCAYWLTPQGGIGPRYRRDGLPDCPDARRDASSPGTSLDLWAVALMRSSGEWRILGIGRAVSRRKEKPARGGPSLRRKTPAVGQDRR